MLAARGGHIETVELLIKTGADVNLKGQVNKKKKKKKITH